MSTKRFPIALLLPPALLAGGCVDQGSPNRQEVAGAADSAGPGRVEPPGNTADEEEKMAATKAKAENSSKAGDIPVAGDDVPEPERGEVTVAARRAPADSGGRVTSPAGLLAGTLALRRNCLVIVGATGVTTLPIFRQGSFAWDGAEGALSYGGRTWRLGETLTLPGGNLPKRSPYVADYRATIDRCGTDDVFIVA